MLQRDSLASDLKYIEDAVADFKTKQPFYNGQFTTAAYFRFSSGYDFTFVTNKTYTQFDIFQTFKSTVQDNPIIEVYLRFYADNDLPFDIHNTQYLTNYLVTDDTYQPGEAPVDINAGTYYLPIGTTVRIKQAVLSTAPISRTFLRTELRP